MNRLLLLFVLLLMTKGLAAKQLSADSAIIEAQFEIGQYCNAIGLWDYSRGLNSPIYREWSFGDGSDTTTTNQKFFEKSYTKDGTYTVRLVVRDLQGNTDTAYKTVTINTMPVVKLPADTIISNGAWLRLENLVHKDDYSYLWSNNSTSSYISVSDIGTYTVSVSYCGNIVSDTILVGMIDTPHVDFTYYVKTAPSRRAEFYADIQPVSSSKEDSIVQFYWVLYGDAATSYQSYISYSRNLVIENYIPGTYKAALRVTSYNYVQSIFSKTIHLPSAIETWALDAGLDHIVTSPCGDTARIVAIPENTDAPYTITWNKPLLPNNRVTTSGRYIAYLKDTTGRIRAIDSVDIELQDKPKAATIVLKRDTLMVTPVYGGSTYEWYKDGEPLNLPFSMIRPTDNGIYTANVVSWLGCTLKIDPYNYRLKDTVNIQPVRNDSLKVSATFKNIFNADNIFTVQLMLNNPNARMQQGDIISLGTLQSNSSNITMQVNIPDSLACASNYVVRITASSPADATAWSEEFSITNQPAKPFIIQRGDSLFVTGKYDWQWYKNGVAIPAATDAKIRATANGNYTVEAKNGESCKTMSSAVAVTITAVGEVTLNGNTAKVFPNPSEGLVNLQFSKPLQKPVTVKVISLQGGLVYHTTTQQQLKTLDLTKLPKGFYMVEITGYGAKKVMTIILQ